MNILNPLIPQLAITDEHAPMRRYLPNYITVKLMYTGFKEKHNIKCSYETYRKEVKLKNISFTKLGEEQCEPCLLHDVHTKAEHQATANLGDNNPDQDCPICEKTQAKSGERKAPLQI